MKFPTYLLYIGRIEPDYIIGRIVIFNVSSMNLEQSKLAIKGTFHSNGGLLGKKRYTA